MKKVLLGAVVFGALALTSCKKDYECEFSYTEGGVTVSGTSEHKDVKKSDADDLEEECKDMGGTWREI